MKTNLSIKDENIYQVILQHLFDFSPFVQEKQPFDFSKLVVYQPNETVKFTSYEDMFKYIFNDKYVGQCSNNIEKHGQFVVLDGDEKHVLRVIFPAARASLGLFFPVTASLGLEATKFSDAETIQHYADNYFGFATCLVDNGV